MLAYCATLTLLLAVVIADGIPEPRDSKVHVVNYGNFNRFLKRYPVVVMEFYAPWCGHCQTMAPVYREAAAIMAEADLPFPVAFGKFDDSNDYNRQLQAGAEHMFNYSSFPTVLVFKDKKIKPANPDHWTKAYRGKPYQYYGGGREKPEDFTFYVTAVSQGLDPFDEERKLKPGFYKEGGKHATPHIIDLEPDGALGFNQTVLEDPGNAVWVIEFYSDRCPFCNSLAPEITRAAEKAQSERPGKVKFGAINSRVYDEIAEQHGVTSWPWICAFYQGKKITDMTGLGGWESVYKFSNKMFEQAWRKTPPTNQFLLSEWATANQPDRPVENAAAPAATAEASSASGNLKEMVALARQYNVKSATYETSMWKKIKEGAKTEQHYIDELTTKLQPVQGLLTQIKDLKRQLGHDEL